MKRDFVFKTEPYQHQYDCFMSSRDETVYAILADMGTGKSKIIIDTAAYLYCQGRINTLVVLAPNGVHENWVKKEIPAHLPDYIDYRAAYWVATPKKQQKLDMDRALSVDAEFFRIIAINVEAASTVRGKKFLHMLADSTRGMLAIDESSRIKTPGVKRTKTISIAGKKFAYRRILTGTPISVSPFDLYAQFAFLDKDIIGFRTFTEFKSYFGVFERKPTSTNRQGYYEELQEYQNIDKLIERIKPFSYRIRKIDCLDLPEKMYEQRVVKLSTEQRRLYNEMEANSIADFRSSSEPGELKPPPGMTDQAELFMWYVEMEEKGKIKARNALTKQLRLQQIVGGHAVDTEGVINVIDKVTPKLTAMLNVIEEVDSKVIIWAKFRPEIEMVAQALKKAYSVDSVVEYHGGIGKEERLIAVDSFQDEAQVRFFVGQPRSGGIGLTLTAANLVVYFSNDRGHETRAQSEDRAHRIGQINPVLYVDLMGDCTIDYPILDRLREQREMSDTILEGLL